jgi:hypothetical protein
MAEDLNRPYVGYRRAGRRPESQQDRSSAADAPLSALRGFASGVLGAPGDIESLIRMLPGLNERTVLPTSADVEKRLPMPELNRTPTGRAFTGAGQLGGGFYAGPGSPLKVIAESPQIIGRAARDFAQSVSPVNVIKPKGGNWLAGSVERALEPMRAYLPSEEMIREAGMNPDIPARHASLAMNKWLDQKLGKYIRNEMATPEDPIRALADRGVTHIPEGVESLERVTEWIPETLESRRKAAGFPAGGMSQTPYGQGWEQLSDEAIHNMPARMRVNPDTGGGSTVALRTEKENPWLMKVPPDTATYGAYPVEVRQELGFEHLVDELRNAVNPESGLPAALQWKYADLDKVTVPQAVERVAKINDWRAAQKAEADMARAMNPATFTHKEYPEQGYKWVELRQPKEVASLSDDKLRAHMTERDMTPDEIDFALSDPQTRAQIEKMANEDYGPLADALKYEGETMGHCVGGYCPDVVEGRSRIFSLRDKKGQPHVTIEVGAPRNLDEQQIPDRYVDEALDMLGGEHPGLDPDKVNNLARELFSIENPAVSDIVQIKGKGNKAPKEEYLPAVQDFVRSGSFGRVGDLGNTGLIDVTQAGPLMKALQDIYGRNMGVGMDKFNAAAEAMPDAQRFMTKDELLKFLGETPPEAKAHGGSVRGYATGGAVETAASGAGEYNPAKIQSLVDSLREEMYG